MRTYITPVNLNKYNSNNPDLYTKCSEIKSTFFSYFLAMQMMHTFVRIDMR